MTRLLEIDESIQIFDLCYLVVIELKLQQGCQRLQVFNLLNQIPSHVKSKIDTSLEKIMNHIY